MNLNKVVKVFQCMAVLFLMQSSAVLDGHTSKQISLQQTIEQQLALEKSSYVDSNQLKRKRRYLEFPEGSSFQLVYDLIVGVVDYTNYLILGVTVALAWELPSKPPSEILSDLKDRLKDGTLGTSRNDTVHNVKYVDIRPKNASTVAIKYNKNLQPLFRPPMHLQYYSKKYPDSYYRKDFTNLQKLNGHTNTWRRKQNNYYSPKPQHPFKQWTSNKAKINEISRVYSKYPWWNLASRWNSPIRKQPPSHGSRRFDQNINKYKSRNYEKSTGRSEHRVFPIFGKRSTSDYPEGKKRKTRNANHFTELDKLHVRHHRSTRHDFYAKIETYLNGRGSNGHHCVLRALCETGQKRHEQRPGSFVGEIMRAIFTLPEPLTDEPQLRGIGYKQQRYDAANSLTGDCISRYHLCKESLWSSHFVM